MTHFDDFTPLPLVGDAFADRASPATPPPLVSRGGLHVMFTFYCAAGDFLFLGRQQFFLVGVPRVGYKQAIVVPMATYSRLWPHMDQKSGRLLVLGYKGTQASYWWIFVLRRAEEHQVHFNAALSIYLGFFYLSPDNFVI
jgi:hypothetical protein